MIARLDIVHLVLDPQSSMVTEFAQLVTELLSSHYDAAALTIGSKLLVTALQCGGMLAQRFVGYGVHSAASAALK